MSANADSSTIQIKPKSSTLAQVLLKRGSTQPLIGQNQINGDVRPLDQSLLLAHNLSFASSIRPDVAPKPVDLSHHIFNNSASQLDQSVDEVKALDQEMDSADALAKE